jgi:hypothetical protein
MYATTKGWLMVCPHENVAWNLFHGAQHRLIADPPPPQVELKHHLFRRTLGSGHGKSRQSARFGQSSSPLPNKLMQITADCLGKNFLAEPVFPP